MTALATNTNENSVQNVMSISTNARIDYILKFSRHAVIVIDEQKQGFGSITGTFLSSLSEQTNAALVGVSSKLNDIQVRARINEQLFPNQAFDPEISLTQSVVEHYVSDSAPIAIVIEQAHHLSLQIIHELALLSELARKSGRDINVVLLGQIALGKLISDNYSLFHKKVSMISAANGQLISAHSPLFKTKVPFLTLTPFNKMVLILLALLIVTFVALYSMYKTDSLQFSQLDAQSQNGQATSTTVVGQLDTEVKPDNTNSNTRLDSAVQAAGVQHASAGDVLAALAGELPVTVEEIQAQPSDILSAINDTPSSITQNERVNIDDSMLKQSLSVAPTKSSYEHSAQGITASKTQPNGFFSDDNGFVIQYAALAIGESQSHQEIVESFARRFLLTDYQFYQRMINQQSFVVITSQTYSERQAAVNAMTSLDSELQQSGIWIKSLETIHKEIAASNMASE